MEKDRPKRLAHASEPAYKQLVRGLCAFVSACALLPQGSNAAYDAWWMAKCILQGAMEQRNVAGVANSKRRMRQRRSCTCDHRGKCRHKCKCEKKCDCTYKRGHPCGETLRRYAKGNAGKDIADKLSEDIADKIAALYRARVLWGPVSLEIAVDKHLIRRFDKMVRALVRAVHDGRGGKYESYTTVQLVVRGTRFVLSAVPVNAGDKTATVLETALRLALERALPDAIGQLRRSNARLDIVFADSEFCSVGVLNLIKRHGLDWLMRMQNSSKTKKFARMIEQEGHGREFADTMKSGDTGETCAHTVIMADRKVPVRRKLKKGEKKDDFPEDNYQPFSTSRPGIDVEEYGKRWGIETGYKMIEDVRVRTRSDSPHVRFLYFAASVVIYNTWVMAGIVPVGRGRQMHITLGELVSELHNEVEHAIGIADGGGGGGEAPGPPDGGGPAAAGPPPRPA